jgi:hypothetical protein
MREALSAVLRRPRLWIEQFIAYLLLGYLAYLWLALPVGRVWQVAVLLITALLWLGALLFVARRAVVMLRRDAPRMPAAKVLFFGVALAAVGLLGPWWLIQWVPTLESFGAQAASFVARFGLAYLLLLGCWLTFASLIAGAGRPASTHDSTAPRP